MGKQRPIASVELTEQIIPIKEFPSGMPVGKLTTVLLGLQEEYKSAEPAFASFHPVALPTQAFAGQEAKSSKDPLGIKLAPAVF